MSGVWYWWRAGRRRTWRPTLGLALIVGALGAATLASLAGARRTASAYARYLRSANASDVFVNTPNPDLTRLKTFAALPGVTAAKAYVGLNAFPVVHGRPDEDFDAGSLIGSVDGLYFTQDRMTVLAGRLPRLDDGDGIALSRPLAAEFGVGVGGRVTFEFYREPPQCCAIIPEGTSTFTVTAIVVRPPVLTDEIDQAPVAIMPPAATQARIGMTAYSWEGLQLAGGAKGIPRLQVQLAGIAAADHTSAIIKRFDTIHRTVQASIRPEAVALATFGLLVAVALLVIATQAMTRFVARWAPDRTSLRAVGATRIQLAVGSGLDLAVAVALGTAVAALGAVALSPLAPVGSVRTYDPTGGVHADLTVLLGGCAALAAVLGGLLVLVSWRSVRREAAVVAPRRSTLAAVAASAGLGVPAVTGARMALEPGRGRGAVPVRAVLIGAVVAVTAVTATVVFGASLDYLVTHPERYGWNWSRLLVDQGGYGSLAQPSNNWNGSAEGDLRSVRALMARQPGVLGWSLLGYAQASIDGHPVPTIGLDREVGSVEPPTGGGRPLGGPDEIELGAVTMRQLHKHIGQTVQFSDGRSTRTMTIVGLMTFPSVGVQQADDPGLGTGAMVEEDTLLALVVPSGQSCSYSSSPGALTECPSMIAVRLARDANAPAWAASVVAANPDSSTPGGTYDQPLVRAAAIVSYKQMTDEPLVLAGLLTFGALVSLAVTLAAAVRQRHRDLAVLKVLGLTGRQLRQAVAWQATLTVLIALVVGIPLGVAAGRVLWIRFADNLGVITTPSVPVLGLVAFTAGLIVLANAAAARPASAAAHLRPAQILRSE